MKTAKKSRFPRIVDDLPIACPAGEDVAETITGSGCRCRIERNTLTTQRDPSSLVAYCLGGYVTCPTWRADKERDWEAKVLADE